MIKENSFLQAITTADLQFRDFVANQYPSKTIPKEEEQLVVKKVVQCTDT